MPTYEYSCKNCGAVLEVEQKITDEPLIIYRHSLEGDDRIMTRNSARGRTVCSGQVRRLISKTSFLLKGGGWASDGYSDSQS